MTTLTREWLKSQISSIEAVGITDSNTLQAFKIALAAMQQEPVAYIFKHPAGRLFWALTDESNKGQSDVMPVYAAPPAPVVPDDVLARIEHEANHVTAWHHMDEYSCKVYRRDLLTLVNACRAATLQGKAEPVSNRDELNSPVVTDGWKLVPLVAFPSQWAAGQKAFDSAGMNKVDAVYKAMVAAAPQQEVK